MDEEEIENKKIVIEQIINKWKQIIQWPKVMHNTKHEIVSFSLIT